MLSFSREEEFPALKDMVYLDHAGTTLAAKSQLEKSFQDLTLNLYGNPHSRSPSSTLSTDVIDQVRYRILDWFGTSADEYSVIFTSGCTGALKLLAEVFDYHGNETCDCSCQSSVPDMNSPKESKECPKDECHSDCKTCGLPSEREKKLCSERGSFSYLMDNHTSVQGMREVALLKAGRVQCLDTTSYNSIHIRSVLKEHRNAHTCGNNLFAYPAQSNFSGKKYPWKWITMVKQCQMEWQRSPSGSGSCTGQRVYYIVLDAACLVGTSPLNLEATHPDFVTVSFYKMFGFPTGLGALIVRNASSHVMLKTYFGGGTVSVSLPTQPFHVARPTLSERFEDGTVAFLDIISLQHGFDTLQNLTGGMKMVSQHTFSVAQYYHHSLSSFCHGNGTRLAEIYCDGSFEDTQKQGAIVTFNLLRSNGEYIGFSEFDKLAQLYHIHVRTGCFCNIGACQKSLGLSDDEIRHNFEAGHVCGDDRDLIDGRPTGAVRVSFGYMSTLEDAQKVLQFIIDCFLENSIKPTFRKNSLTQSNQLMDKKAEPVERNKNESLSFQNNTAVKKHPCKMEVDSKKEVNDKMESELNLVEILPKELAQMKTSLKEVPIISKFPEETFSKQLRKIAACSLESTDTARHVNNVTVSNLCPQLAQTALTTGQRFVTAQDHDAWTFESCRGRYLSDIFLYPVKSCAAFRVESWPLGDRGLLYDREWMIVTHTGIAMSQKRETRLCLLQPSIDLGKGLLMLCFPGMDPVSVPLEMKMDNNVEHALCSSKVCGDRVKSVDCGDEVAEWLCEALCREGCRLIRQASQDTRASRLKTVPESSDGDKGRLSLANESQYLLITRDSVSALQERILQYQQGEDTQESFDVDNLVYRFRGNFVVTGCDPFEEDTWSSVQIGKLRFVAQGQCTRCQMVCMDQQTGERSKEPLKTLACWRGSKVPFGIHLCAATKEEDTNLVLHVGDPVFVS